MRHQLIIVGAGAAGLMAAYIAAKDGATVLLIERNRNIGRKLLITGAGRCNLTNEAEINEIITNTPGNGRFLFSALQHFSPIDLMQLFEEEFKVPLKVERGRRVFPVSDKSIDIVNGFLKGIQKAGVDLLTGIRIVDLYFDEQGRIAGVIDENGKKYQGDQVILATGGVSYPGTGSTGDGYKLAQKAGHTITEIFPSLIPLETKEEWPKQVEGLTLTNINATCLYRDKKTDSEFGDLLFTGFGVSGPVILSLSRKIVPLVLKEVDSVILEIDLKPALSAEEVDRRIQRDFNKFLRKVFKNALDELLPKSLIAVIIELSRIDPMKPVHQITREERLELVKLLKHLPLTIRKPRPINEAIITAGGVNVKEINPKTMESKNVPGLYLIGELVDVDAYTGGYNLQIAFSMGYAAGKATTLAVTKAE